MNNPVREPSVAALKAIVAESQAVKFRYKVEGKVRKILVDAFTASAIVKVYDAVNESNKAKIEALVTASPAGLNKVASIAFGAVK